MWRHIIRVPYKFWRNDLLQVDSTYGVFHDDAEARTLVLVVLVGSNHTLLVTKQRHITLHAGYATAEPETQPSKHYTPYRVRHWWTWNTTPCYTPCRIRHWWIRNTRPCSLHAGYAIGEPETQGHVTLHAGYATADPVKEGLFLKTSLAVAHLGFHRPGGRFE